MNIKFFLLAFIIVCQGGLYAAGINTGVPVKFSSDPSNGFYWPYYMYIPDTSGISQSEFTFLVIPNNTGKVSNDFSLHEEKALKTVNNGALIASKLKVIILVPVFPRSETNWQIYTHALDRDVMLSKNDSIRRLDLQLNKMIDDAKVKLSEEGIKVKEKILLMGFSASGMFVNRYTLIHPGKVLAAAIGSPGGWPMVPAENFNGAALNYPVGINDFKLVTGAPFNKSEFEKVKICFFLGDEDDNDSVPFDDSYDEPERKAIADNFGMNLQERWKTASEVYKNSGLTNCNFILYPGVGHSINKTIQEDLFIYFENVMKE